jgi:acyl-CoA thioester hydrolase
MSTPTASTTATGPTHVHPLRVYWEDTDASGVVYHANYLRWFERARTEWLRALGYSQDRLMTEVGIAFTVASIEILYRRPARLDDQIEVFTSIAELKNVSLIFSQVLRRVEAPDEILAKASVRVACVDAKTFMPRRIPPLGW